MCFDFILLAAQKDIPTVIAQSPGHYVEKAQHIAIGVNSRKLNAFKKLKFAFWMTMNVSIRRTIHSDSTVILNSTPKLSSRCTPS